MKNTLISTTTSYFDFLDRINNEMGWLDEEQYTSETIRPLCKKIDLRHQDFWHAHFETILESPQPIGTKAFLLWGDPPFRESRVASLNLEEDITIRKLLCYGEVIAIPDYVGNVLDYTSPQAPGDWHTIFKTLKKTIKMLLPLKTFAERGIVIVFPGYHFCRSFWRDVYVELEKETKRLFYADEKQIEPVQCFKVLISLLK